ncbi:hypothetical protein ACIRSU_08985 [Streptomyces sp. NPDC101160]|uniref:hypothetical protein n=1 Tax=Streptomyces sp. NPDC101160 TaxID=3366118 RepID=UPI00382AF1E4
MTARVDVCRLSLDRFGLPAHRVLFVDDAEPNVLGARAVGCGLCCTPTATPPGQCPPT